jgi:hypothetical protein
MGVMGYRLSVYSRLSRLAVVPLAECWVLWQEATRSKVLKVLKVLNFTETEKSNIFDLTFTGGAAVGPDPAARPFALWQ